MVVAVVVAMEGEDEDDSSYVWRDASWMNGCWKKRDRKKTLHDVHMYM